MKESKHNSNKINENSSNNARTNSNNATDTSKSELIDPLLPNTTKINSNDSINDQELLKRKKVNLYKL